MSHIVDVELLVKQGSQTGTQLNNMIKHLEQIQKKSKINLSVKTNEIKQANKLVNGLGKSVDKLNKVQKTNEKTVGDLSSAYAGLRMAMSLKNTGKQMISELIKIDKAMFDLGIVAGKSSNEIEAMKYEFLDMATEFPQSAVEIANAVDILVRSGLDYETTVKGIDASIKLATASGEKLSDVSGINFVPVKFLFMLETPKVA